MAHLIVLVIINSCQTVTESEKSRGKLPLQFSKPTAHLGTEQGTILAVNVTHWLLAYVWAPISRPIWTWGNDSRIDGHAR